MKKITILVFAFTVLLGCNTESKSKDTSDPTMEIAPQKPNTTSSLKSGDYTTLFENYKCPIIDDNLAQALEVSPDELTQIQTNTANLCVYQIQGFGKNKLNEPAQLSWGPIPSTKAANKNEIQSGLKIKEDDAPSELFGMGISLADTQDSYIYRQPHVGRVLIYNENYDQAFLISYGMSGSVYNDRTPEQHQELTQKMVMLANYLLKKHRK
ncbi:hypothetical protein [Croceiramulus getboli]|nr:hypothetical protein P8624_09685 [Flavobacteriaceae bacterium YJPT1-3]